MINLKGIKIVIKFILYKRIFYEKNVFCLESSNFFVIVFLVFGLKSEWMV